MQIFVEATRSPTDREVDAKHAHHAGHITVTALGDPKQSAPKSRRSLHVEHWNACHGILLETQAITAPPRGRRFKLREATRWEVGDARLNLQVGDHSRETRIIGADGTNRRSANETHTRI